MSASPTEEQQETPDGQEQEQEGQQQETTVEQQEGNPSREAAKYRTRLREAEAREEALSQRLQNMQRDEAERLASQQLKDPADLWRDGLELDALLDENGELDAEATSSAVQQVLQDHPHWSTAYGSRNEGAREAATQAPSGPISTGRTWKQVLHPASGR